MQTRRVYSLCLVSLLAGIYFLTYRGFPVSLDELALFSSTESLVKYHELRLVSLYHEFPVVDYAYANAPWQPSLHEPLQSILAAPLYWLAQHVIPVGLLHLVWLFNLGVGIGIALTIYRGGVALGYSDTASWLTAMILALGTMLWHYSLTFFREPLVSFLLLLVFVMAFHLRERRRWWLTMGLVFLGAVLTKIAALLALPALLFILFPNISRRTLLMVAGGTIVLLALSFGANQLIPNERFALNTYIGRLADSDFDYVITVTGAYLISPGRSIWATSPILLLSLYGAWILYRENKPRFALAPLLLLLVWTLGYGLGGWDWHGGRGWGSRYLLPVVPVMGLLLLPVMQAFLDGKISRRWWIPAGVLLAFSIIVQCGSVFVSLDRYYEIIPTAFPNNTLDAFYNEGTWQIRYTQWYINLREFDFRNLDIAWAYTDSAWRGIVIGILLIGTAFFTFWMYRRHISVLRFSLGATAFLMTAGYSFGLGALDQDKRLLADRPELHQLLEAVNTQVGQDDLLLLSDPEYRDFFLNFYKGDAMLVTLPYAPGERYSFEQIPLIQTDFPDERLSVSIRAVLDYAVKQVQTIWLVSDVGPFHPWAYRPVEQYLARHFYPVSAVENIAPNTRLIRFNTTPAPAYDYRYHTLYVIPHDPFRFGDHILLSGYQFPRQVKAGEVLPVSLRWESTGSVDVDYNVGVFLVNQEGVLVTSRQGQPQGTFGYTSQWEAGIPQGDNHGLLIPADLPPGTYTLQIVMYDWRDAARLPVFKDGDPIEGDFAALGSIDVLR